MKAFVAGFLPLLIAYGATLLWCVDRWNAPTEYFAHCWLVPLVGAFVVWRRAADWRARPAAFDRRGLWLLVPGLLLHFAGALLMIDSWSAASLVLAVPGAAWTVLGRERLRGLWPVLWLVLFVVPLPMYVEGRLAFTLKEFAVTGGAWLANLLGAGVVRGGDLLRLSGTGGSLYVADACSGLRSLLAMATVAYCLAFFTGSAAVVRRAVLLLIAAPLALVANVVRIAALCLMARWFGVPFTEASGHTIANIAEWVALLGSLLLTDAWLTRRLPERVQAPMAPTPIGAPAPAPVGRGLLITAWVVALPLLALSLYRPLPAAKTRAERLPATVAGFTHVPRSDAEQAQFERALPRWRELLGTGDFVWRRYRAGPSEAVQLVALFHDANWKSVHPPRICIEGSNMDIEQDDLVPAPWLGDGALASRIVARGRASRTRFVTLSVFGTATWSSGDYWQFTLYHLPRALLRANESGFLLRVESAIGAGEGGTAAAEARCASFLREIVPMAQDLAR